MKLTQAMRSLCRVSHPLSFYWRVILREYASGTNTAALVSEWTTTSFNTVGKRGKQATKQNNSLSPFVREQVLERMKD
jgi:hypothetical protein